MPQFLFCISAYHLNTIFRDLGNEWSLSDEIMTDLEKFTCIMYGQARETSVNTVRVNMLKKMVGEDETLNSKSKVDLARIPPCLDSLIPHSQRCNHRLACHKRAHQAIIEKPKPYDTDQGWCKVEGGSLEPVWTKGPVLPLSLIELLDSGDWDDEDEEDESIDYEDIFDEEADE